MKRELSELECEFDVAKNIPLMFNQLTPGRRKPVIWRCGTCHQIWSATVSNRLKGTGCPYCNHHRPIVGVNDFKTLHPRIASEWDYDLNGDKLPENYLPQCNLYFQWICEKGHSFRARINNRMNRNSPCPCCDGQIPIPGENDFGTLYPHLVKEWAFDLNGDKKPSDFFPKSNVEVQWRCSFGHTWPAKIYHRVEGSNCPYCEGHKPVIGQNDFATIHPRMAKQWHPDRNNGRRPEEFLPNSHFDVWWICPKGHEYPSPIYRRSRGCGCSVCDGKRVVPGVNDLATLAPKLSREWNYERNGDVTPEKVALHSNTRYHWKCQECGHSWFVSPNNRSKGTGCPKCAHFVVDPNVNSIAARNEALAKQWDMERNAPLTPWDVAAYDNRDYHWICEEGHSFIASPANRNNGTECPYCQHKKPIVGENDLATLYPRICRQWHPTKNGGKQPSDYLPQSHEMIHWQCEAGHEWEIEIYQRVNGNECPYCENRLPIAGETDLGTLHPELIKRWHPTRNRKSPDQYFPDSSVRVAWQCEFGHSFRAPIREMVNRWRCPKCERNRKRR